MIERKEPWLTEDANKILAHLVDTHKDLTVFEFGSGASTIWFSKQKNIKQLVSCEHNKEWNEKVWMHVNRAKLDFYYLRDLPYNNIIKDFKFNTFDIILVDGRNRVKCIESALPHLKPTGVLILDNSERDYYQPGMDLMKNFQRIDTFQPNPDKYGFTYSGWSTSFFFNNQKK